MQYSLEKWKGCWHCYSINFSYSCNSWQSVGIFIHANWCQSKWCKISQYWLDIIFIYWFVEFGIWCIIWKYTWSGFWSNWRNQSEFDIWIDKQGRLLEIINNLTLEVVQSIGISRRTFFDLEKGKWFFFDKPQGKDTRNCVNYSLKTDRRWKYNLWVKI